MIPSDYCINCGQLPSLTRPLFYVLNGVRCTKCEIAVNIKSDAQKRKGRKK